MRLAAPSSWAPMIKSRDRGGKIPDKYRIPSTGVCFGKPIDVRTGTDTPATGEGNDRLTHRSRAAPLRVPNGSPATLQEQRSAT